MNKLPDIHTQFSEWYQEVVYQAELADQAPVRGCIIIRPYGNEIWEQIKSVLDKRIKETGHENALFPVLIPKSFIEKEADHVAGFAPELITVTHVGDKELEEKLVVRPTSETIVHYMFAKWIQSYRDLPLKINQWANVMRWEKRPRAFLRTSEFYWQEGHTAHATEQEALEETLLMLQEYVNLAQNYLAIPVITGRKSPTEQFPGALATYTFEAFMIDGKAVQMGTSHLLSQTFAKAFDMKFQTKEGNVAYQYLTSWGVTTRLIGAIIASHGDNKGLIIPPKVAPIQVVIVPIYKTDEEKLAIEVAVTHIQQGLAAQGVRVKFDHNDQMKPGAKFYKWELKGVPVRIEIGPRDLTQQVVVVSSRLDGIKQTIAIAELDSYIPTLLETIQQQLFARAQQRYAAIWHTAEKMKDFGPQLAEQNGIYQTGWCGNAECEALLKEYQGSIRCLLATEKKLTHCFACEQASTTDVIVAKSY